MEDEFIMRYRHFTLTTSPYAQRGVSVLVVLVMLLVLTLIGVSSMNTAIVELKMAGSMQQQGVALNRAEETLDVGQQDIDAIIANAAAFDFAAAGDGYYVNADAIDVHDIDWAAQGLNATTGTNATDLYVTEYLGAKPIPGESVKVATDGRIIGGAVHTFRITTRSAAGKNALRLVQAIYVSDDPP
jgi:type IV pilus assembly protein PilX